MPFAFGFAADLPEIDTDTMIEVDRLMVEEAGISLMQMMENAGRALAVVVREVCLGGVTRQRHVAVLAGSGGNGGGTLTAARRLATWGARVSVHLTRPPDALTPVPRRQLDILRGLSEVEVLELGDMPVAADAILDGIVGYSLTGNPTGQARAAIDWANNSGVPIVSLDVPSGFDARAGVLRNPAIRATATLTLALPKTGLQSAEARSHVGDLYCADISVPPDLYRGLPSPVDVGPIFDRSDILQLRG